MRLRGHKQRKLNDHVYRFLLFVSSKPQYQAEFGISKVAYWNYTVNKIAFSPSCMFLTVRSTATGDFRPIFGRADFAQLPFVLLLAPLAIEEDCLAEAISSNYCL